MNAAQLVERVEQLLRIAALVGQREHLEKLLAIADEYIARAEAESPGEDERERLAVLKAKIAAQRSG